MLAADGRILAFHGASEPALAEHARALAGLIEPGGELLVSIGRGGAATGSSLVLRAPAPASDAASATLVIAAGPHALLPLLRHDAAQLLRDLEAEQHETPVAAPTPDLSPAEPLAIWAPSGAVELFRCADSTAATAIFAGLGLLAAGNS